MQNRIWIESFRQGSTLRLSTLLSVLVCLVLLVTASQLNAQPTASPAVWTAASPQSLTITSSSGLTSIPQVLTQGASNLDFSASGCSNSSTSCALTVKFSPTANGWRYGAVVLTDATGTTVVPLSGFGTGAAAIFPPGTISTFAGVQYLSPEGTQGSEDGDDGPATDAYFWGPNGFALDGAGNIYIADLQNYVIRKIDAKTGDISLAAGVPGISQGTKGVNICASSSDAYGDGCSATEATLYYPEAILIDGAGNLIIADAGDNLIRIVAPDGANGQDGEGTISVVVSGDPSGYACQKTPSITAGMCYPNALAIDQSGNLYISDSFNNVIRMFTPGSNGATGGGTMSVVVGGGTPSTQCGADPVFGNGCAPTQAILDGPQDLAFDASGNLYIADNLTSQIREVTLPSASPTISAVAGIEGDIGYAGDNGPATSALLYYPYGVKLDGAGNIYIADSYNNVIRKVSNGVITTVAGNYTAGAGYSGNGGAPASAQLNYPTRIWVDGVGNLLIADYNNNVVRKVDVSDVPIVPAFASTTVGQVTTGQDVTLMNNGTSTLTGSVSVPPNFTLGGASNPCPSSGLALSAGSSCVFGIEFAPTSSGPASGNLVLADNSVTGAQQTITLSGTGLANLESQTITFNNPGNQFDGGSYPLDATASSGLTVSYSITSGASIATLNGSTLTFTGVGSVTVQASQAGNGTYAAATPVSQTFTVAPMPSYTLSLTSSAISIAAGGTGTANFSVTSQNYAGSIQFVANVTTTNGVASDVTATVTPNPITLTSGGTTTFTLTVATTSGAANHAPVLPWKSGGAVMLCAVLFGAPLGFRRKRAIAMMLTASALLLAGFLMACSSGSSGSSNSTSTTKAARTYTVTVTPTGTGQVTNAQPASVTVTVQ